MPPNLTSGSLLIAEATIDRPISVQQPYGSTFAARAKSVPVPTRPSERTPQRPSTWTKTVARCQEIWTEVLAYAHMDIVWRNVIAFVYLHGAAIYALLFIFPYANPLTILFGVLTGVCGGIGITAGAHRLWAHRSYKAKWPLRLILTIFQTIAFQNHIYEWVRDHRVHHKFTDSNADPHNASRGFFFSHIGWLMLKKHPDVKGKGKKVEMGDLERDPLVVFQRKYYMILMPLLTFIIPTMIPVYLWGENGWYSWYVTVARYTLGLNGTWLVNSAAHIWGTRPIDKNISPTENKSVAWLAFGEGWHNYHHVFPFDYKAAELGNYKGNLTTGFIDFFAKIGWAYELKTVDASMVKKRVGRTGDGTHPKYPLNEEVESEAHTTEEETHHHKNPYGKDLWGYDDKDMTEESREAIQILYQKRGSDTKTIS